MLKEDHRNYILAGLPFMMLGLIINPWLISWMLNVEFTTTIFSGILVFSIVMIVTGWGIIYKKSTFGKWLGAKYNDVALILLNIVLVFAVLNVIAAIVLFKPEKLPETGSYIHSPADLLKDSIGFMRQVYPGRSDDEIRELVMFRSPYVNHPILEFQEKIQNSKYYNVGFEDIRYDRKVNRENASKYINGSVWVFGGSTTFGQGVSDNETISAFLNMLDTSNTYLNFGVHAYHQSNEIEKLLLLLKKGYKPKSVIFIDGLNDVIRMIETNFHPMETPSLAKSAYNSDYNIATKETGNTVIKQMPVTRLLRLYFGKKKGPDDNLQLPWNKYDDVYDENNLYNKDAKQHFQSTLLRSPYKDIDTIGLNYITWKLQEMYTRNYDFIDHISKAYGFDFTIYYQPIGILSSENQFWKEMKSSRLTPLYRNFNYVIPKIKKSIIEWNYPHFIDITALEDSCSGCYVDLTHYNAQLNKLIARKILATEFKK
ncbi:MAG TPA: hypothetical protein VK172_01765 [Lentimicrobium sp.]|nr:hypothetical protein [Lentimicrobium sp.]